MNIFSLSPSLFLFISFPLFFLSGGSGPLALTGVSCCRKWRDHFYPSLSLLFYLSLSELDFSLNSYSAKCTQKARAARSDRKMNETQMKRLRLATVYFCCFLTRRSDVPPVFFFVFCFFTTLGWNMYPSHMWHGVRNGACVCERPHPLCWSLIL